MSDHSQNFIDKPYHINLYIIANRTDIASLNAHQLLNLYCMNGHNDNDKQNISII